MKLKSIWYSPPHPPQQHQRPLRSVLRFCIHNLNILVLLSQDVNAKTASTKRTNTTTLYGLQATSSIQTMQFPCLQTFNPNSLRSKRSREMIPTHLVITQLSWGECKKSYVQEVRRENNKTEVSNTNKKVETPRKQGRDPPKTVYVLPPLVVSLYLDSLIQICNSLITRYLIPVSVVHEPETRARYRRVSPGVQY